MASSILRIFQTVTELLKKYDGRDKVLATLQYVLMFLAAGQPGKLLVVQKALAGSRKPFRIAKVGIMMMIIIMLRYSRCYVKVEWQRSEYVLIPTLLYM